MSEYDSPQERHEPRDMTVHLDMYWADCTYKDNSPAEMQASLERLVQAELGLSAKESDRLSEALSQSDVLPTYRQFEESPQEAQELFGLAPLRFLASYIEMTCSLDEIRRWYDRAVYVALQLSPNHTNGGCLQLTDDAAPTIAPDCGISDLCPRKYLQTTLAEPALRAPTEKSSLAFDPLTHFDLIEVKLALAIRQGLITPERGSTLMNRNRVKRRMYLERPFKAE